MDKVVSKRSVKRTGRSTEVVSLAPDDVFVGGGVEILQSYGLPVAAFIPGHGYVATRAHYSVTTTKHIYQFADKSWKDLPQVPQVLLDRLTWGATEVEMAIVQAMKDQK